MDLSGNSRQGTGKKPYDLPPESARSAPVGPLNRRRMGPDRKKLTVSRAFLLVLLVCAIPISGDIRSENPGIHDVDYPLRTFKFFRRTIIANRDPSVDVDFDSRMIRFSAVVTYLGEYRPLSDSKTEKFKILNTVNVLHEKIWFFNYEVKVRDEEGREFWIPANKVLAQRIDENVEKGADF
ncbi:MAG: hypothetical protein KDK25_12145, partial [Leptospiraceae bacterium]|nr:hypothetical protein [Leptospiraceae bacterium]